MSPDTERVPPTEPRTWCEHRDVISLLNWVDDGEGGTKPDGNGYSIYCRDCQTSFEPRAQAGPPPLSVPDWIIARAAKSIHLNGEGEDCDPDTEDLWCESCWIDATNWLDPSVKDEADDWVASRLGVAPEASEDQ